MKGPERGEVSVREGPTTHHNTTKHPLLGAQLPLGPRPPRHGLRSRREGT